MVVDRPDVLPPGGSVHEETDVELSAPEALGWARVTCTGPVKASLLFRRFEGGVLVGEAGVNATAVPATRFVTFAEQGEGQYGDRSGLCQPLRHNSGPGHLYCPGRGMGTNGGQQSTLGPYCPDGHEAQNMALLFDLTSFNGSLEITSTEPIVTLSINAEAAPVFSSLPPGELE